MPSSCSRLLPLLAVLALGGCEVLGLGPSDEPLPTAEQLRAAYDEQEPGTGTVREGESYRGGGYPVAASFVQSGEGELRRVFVELDSAPSLIRIGIAIARRSGIGISDLEPGMSLDASFSYGGEGDGKSGSGHLYVTAVEEGRVAGVFAADLTSSGLIPADLRITGAFHAVPAEE